MRPHTPLLQKQLPKLPKNVTPPPQELLATKKPLPDCGADHRGPWVVPNGTANASPRCILGGCDACKIVVGLALPSWHLCPPRGFVKCVSLPSCSQVVRWRWRGASPTPLRASTARSTCGLRWAGCEGRSVRECVMGQVSLCPPLPCTFIPVPASQVPAPPCQATRRATAHAYTALSCCTTGSQHHLQLLGSC